MDPETICEEFIQEYWKDPYGAYMNTCGISEVWMCCDDASPEETHNLCIFVHLNEAFPSGISLPYMYKDLRVFVHVSGKIFPQK